MASIIEGRFGFYISKLGLLLVNEISLLDVSEHPNVSELRKICVAITGNIFDPREVSGNVCRESSSRNLRMEREC